MLDTNFNTNRVNRESYHVSLVDDMREYSLDHNNTGPPSQQYILSILSLLSFTSSDRKHKANYIS